MQQGRGNEASRADRSQWLSGATSHHIRRVSAWSTTIVSCECDTNFFLILSLHMYITKSCTVIWFLVVTNIIFRNVTCRSSIMMIDNRAVTVTEDCPSDGVPGPLRLVARRRSRSMSLATARHSFDICIASASHASHQSDRLHVTAASVRRHFADCEYIDVKRSDAPAT